MTEGALNVKSRISIVAPRLDAKPWGGRRLDRFGIALPQGERIGEALVTAGDAMVTSGFGAGKTLDALLAEDVDGLGGSLALAATGGRAMFPLLVKLIDASENLSVQVHPDDGAAASLDKLGKTEAWFVLAADEGAHLYVGLNDAVDFEEFKSEAAKLDGSSAAMMRTVEAVSGETVLIPAGTIHALGAGVIVYEVQQPSDVTYRLDDWGRVDSQGNPREVHLDAGYAVSRPAMRPEMIAPVALTFNGGTRDLLTACRYFALERLTLEAGGSASIGRLGSPSVVTVLEGNVEIEGQPVRSGQSAVIWAGQEDARIQAIDASTALVCWVPDLNAEVVEPALAAGAKIAEVAALSGETGDIATDRPST
jgi:mannose-6-phosphate isomerase